MQCDICNPVCIHVKYLTKPLVLSVMYILLDRFCLIKSLSDVNYYINNHNIGFSNLCYYK